ncbi:MAG: hypothetical protein GX610_21790 [Rhodococcus sp.]|nr:hypothetical protein [Rhodococcus sp. (in: high G+C Gram-positive bacteria)]
MVTPRHAEEWSVWGLHARVVVTDAAALDSATNLIRGYLSAADVATNRDRADSEIRNLRPGHNTVTPMFARFVSDALAAAQAGDGTLGPTVTGADWRGITVDGTDLHLPDGVELDLSATARASAADHCAASTAELLECGVLVALGGDIAAAGTTPSERWQVQVQDLPGDPTCQISIPSGAGVATASTVKPLHPESVPQWRTVSVVAQTCTRAHMASTTAVGMAGGAIDYLDRLELPARLVDQEFRVVTIGGWPS